MADDLYETAFGIERAAPEVHAGEVDARLEDVGVARQRLRREHAAVGETPDADASRIDVRSRLQVLAAGEHVLVLRVAAPPVFGAVRNELP